MIPITRAQQPPELTAQIVAELTAEFVADHKKSVWNKPYIRSTLLQMAHGKCAYCETAVDEESKYMEVEHFRCKIPHTDLVVEWTNLLPACKRCNVNKLNHDVDVHGMIIDPTIDIPKDHLSLSNYRLRGKTDLGRLTVDVIYLNETNRVVQKRFEIGEAIANTIEKIRAQLDEHLAGETSARKINRIVRGMQALLDEASPIREFSATAATSVLADPDYTWIKTSLQAEGLWSPDLAAAESIALTIAL